MRLVNCIGVLFVLVDRASGNFGKLSVPAELSNRVNWTTSGRIRFPDDPRTHCGNGTSCAYTIPSIDGCKIAVSLSTINYRSGDFFSIYNGRDQVESALLARFSSLYILERHQKIHSRSYGDPLTVVFTSDKKFPAAESEFEIQYESLCEERNAEQQRDYDQVYIALGTLVFIMAVVIALCCYYDRVRKKKRWEARERANTRVRVQVTTTNPRNEALDAEILQLEVLSSILSPPTYNVAMALPTFEEPPRLPSETRNRESEPPPPSYESIDD